ncbi:MAG TPA: hypothetical protein VF593_07710, partial [Chthoniobacteraceae bacterium]
MNAAGKRLSSWRWLGLIAALLPAGTLQAEQRLLLASEVVKPEESAAKSYAPEVEAKFAEFMKKLGAARRDSLDDRMRKEIEEIGKVTKMDAPTREALQAPAKRAAELCAESWSQQAAELARKSWPFERVPQILEEMAVPPDALLQGWTSGNDERPMDHAVWKEALQRTLSPAQLTSWEKAQVERKRVLSEEIGDFMKAQEERTREQITPSIVAKTAEIKRVLALPQERGEKLDVAMKKAVAGSLARWREQTEKSLLDMPAENRRQMLKQQNVFYGLDEKHWPEQQALWKVALAELLTPAEHQRLAAVAEERKARRIRAMGQVLIAEFDRRVAFTSEQRERLRPLAERLIRDEPTLFPKNENEGNNYGLSTFFQAGAKAKEEELQALLDPIQIRRWKEVSSAKPGENDGEDEGMERARPLKADAVPVIAPEPEEVERVISDFIHERSERELKRLLAVHVLKAEDAARIAGLRPETVARLETAARGAADASMAEWRTNIEPTVRAQVSDATMQDVKLRLAGIQEYYFRRTTSGPAKSKIWETTVKAELTPEQRAAWEKEEAA